jgi:hypothetical protein
MDGISFLIRCRNEEATLEASIRSLATLTVPHEIVVILHRCTDRSRAISIAIAETTTQPVRIREYNEPVSRAGYETLATDATSSRSFITYCNWCQSQAAYKWVFKWDADFLMTAALATYINTETALWSQRHVRIRLGAQNSTHTEKGDYLCSSIQAYNKHVFWEVPYHIVAKTIELEAPLVITHASDLGAIKSYWSETPWYLTEDTEEAAAVKQRLDRLIAEFGAPPQGLARSCNPDCGPFYSAIVSKNPSYVNLSS